jgi:hypothetical protein
VTNLSGSSRTRRNRRLEHLRRLSEDGLIGEIREAL